jgi:ABC-2 type transport system permease protein
MKTLTLAEATLRGTTWISTDGLRELGRRDRLWVLPIAGLGILVGLAVIEFMLVGVYRSLLAAGQATGHPEMVIFYGLLGSWAFLFITAIPLALSVLYYSTDLKLLLTLPLRPLSIMGAKGLLLYIYCLPVNFALFIPALWLYAASAGISAALVVSAAIALFLLPLLPLSLAVLLVLALMKAVNLSRYRVALEVAGMALGITLLIGMQVLLSRTTIASLDAGSSQALTGFSGMYDRVAGALPPVAWAARAFVSGSGPMPLLLILAVTAALFVIVMLLAPINFARGVMERREAGGERRRAGLADAAFIAGRSLPRSVVRRLVGREWAVLSSNSTFIFEAIGELLVLPLVLGVYGLILPRAMVGQAMRFITAMPVLGLALMGVVVLMTSLTTVSSTSLSREGKRIGLSLCLPIPGRLQVRAKLYFHLLFFSTAYVVDLVIVWVLFRFPPLSLVYMLPGGIALQIVAFTVSISFDLKRPLLTWTHPQQAMKNNMNALSGIGCSAAIVVIIVGPCALAVLKGMNQMLFGCIAAGAGIVLAAILLPRVMAFADKQYAGGLELEG